MAEAPDPFAAIRVKFLVRLVETAQQLDGLGPDALRASDVISTVHRLAGLAGTLGYGDVTAAAKALEQAMRASGEEAELVQWHKALLATIARALAERSA